LSDITTEDVFTWEDGSPVGFENWKKGQPDDSTGKKDCVVMRGSGKWDDVGCGTKEAFVCQKLFS